MVFFREAEKLLTTLDDNLHVRQAQFTVIDTDFKLTKKYYLVHLGGGGRRTAGASTSTLPFRFIERRNGGVEGDVDLPGVTIISVLLHRKCHTLGHIFASRRGSVAIPAAGCNGL